VAALQIRLDPQEVAELERPYMARRAFGHAA
jgi:hypothetical protein